MNPATAQLKPLLQSMRNAYKTLSSVGTELLGTYVSVLNQLEIDREYNPGESCRYQILSAQIFTNLEFSGGDVETGYLVSWLVTPVKGSPLFNYERIADQKFDQKGFVSYSEYDAYAKHFNDIIEFMKKRTDRFDILPVAIQQQNSAAGKKGDWGYQEDPHKKKW